VCAVIYNDKQWASFFNAIGKSEIFETDPRFKNLSIRTQHINDLQALVAKIFVERTTEEWLKLLELADIPTMPLHSLETIFDDPHLNAIEFFKWKEHPTEGRIRVVDVPTTWTESQPAQSRHAPRLGEHSIEVLRELGYSDQKIADMVSQGVTLVPDEK
jgi:crotonobetainyl-CoA:carnitine CoA-transferase CaiB-like acyl-CoA transferase